MIQLLIAWEAERFYLDSKIQRVRRHHSSYYLLFILPSMMSAVIPIHRIPTNAPHRPTSRSSSSVRRGSPLSRSFDPSELDDTTTDDSGDSGSPQKKLTVSPSHHRRPSSFGIFEKNTGLSSPISPSPPIAGSYITSLLSGRVASSNSHATTFNFHLSACASLQDAKPSSKAKPRPLQMAFQATWHDITGPYTATIDISEYLREHVGENCIGESADLVTGDPDYPLPSSKGQVQLIITNEMGTLIKMFIVPYDFTSMRKSGTQIIRRQVWCTRVKHSSPISGDTNDAEIPTLHSSQDTIRYAAQLHFVCRPYHRPRRTPRTSDVIESSSKALLKRLEQVALSTEAPVSLFPVDMEIESANSIQPQPSSTAENVSTHPSKAKIGRAHV